MQYFAQRYGYVAVGSIFPGIKHDREPTAAELAALAAKIEELGVTTIFTETSVNDRLSLAIAQETGAKVIKLYTDSLGTKENHCGYLHCHDGYRYGRNLQRTEMKFQR